MQPGASASVGVGSRIGTYEIVGWLGAGGMGRVYRAHDTRLGRDVAIKVLPDAFAADPDRLARFEGEARILAALNHPHIAAIYGFEEAAGVRALVLELVAGPTLAEAIARGIERPRALKLACQIADALAAAHAHAIVHRDLKPANIQVAPGDTIKVLDFGVAKMCGPDTPPAVADASTVTAAHTRAGQIVGTAAYMSPEQARGTGVDHRADVWAFGCVLFEMLSGRAPFAAATSTETIAAVLERDPDWRLLPAATPARVRSLLRRLLAKNPAARPATMGEIRAELERALAGMTSRRRWYGAAAAAAIGCGAILLAAYRWTQGPPLPSLGNPAQITRATGVEDYPMASPDGKFVVYESNQSGNWDIWISDIDGGGAVNRTAGSLADDRYPAWSPDGHSIAFWSMREGRPAYYVMSALGGDAERVSTLMAGAEINYGPPVWSPDGAQLGFLVYAPTGSRNETAVELLTVATKARRRIRMPGTQEGRLDMAWSHDGRHLAYLDIAQQPAETSRLMVLDLADGSAWPLTDDALNIRSPIWDRDDRAIYFVCNLASTWDLWRLRLDAARRGRGQKERVTTGLDILHASFAAGGRRLVYAKGRWVSNVWRLPVDRTKVSGWGEAEQLTFDQAFAEFAQASPDGQWLAFSSDRMGNQDLWKMRIGARAPAVRLTTEPSLEWAPYWSPTADRLAFYSNRTGNREIYVMPADGGPPTQLTDTRTSLNAGGAWSPDGSEIAFRSERSGSSDLWVMSADGARSRVLAASPAAEYGHAWSPTGEWIAFTSDRNGPRQLWRVRADGCCPPEQLTQSQAASPIWSTDGDEIYYRGIEGARASRIFALPLATRRERLVADFSGRRGEIGFQPLSTDGRYLYFTWRDDLGDIWIMDAR